MTILILMLVSCTTLHKEGDTSYHFKAQADSMLSKRFMPVLKLHPGKSGIIPLRSGEDALVTRIRSIREAQFSIDLQYYIWKDDVSGLILLKELISAASRGVRVRMLLDNFYESRYETGLKILDEKSNIEVRLIDTNYQNLNRRMHNKSFTVDNQLSIVGGRNIGDDYFELSKLANFKDYDVLMIGPVVNDVSIEFDQYWNSKRSYPVSEIAKNPIEKRERRKAEERLAEVKEFPLPAPKPMKELAPFWSDVHVVYDPPEKLEGKKQDNLSMKLRPGITDLQKELILISPYFIPGHRGMKTLKHLKDRNVRIVILTNSLLSTDVLTTFSGYMKYREDLVKMGVEIYEFKALGKPKKSSSLASSGSMGLHGKVMIGDRQKMFVGSMNLDPRSRDINSEMGVIILSSEMAGHTAQELLKSLPDIAYRVDIRDKKLKWIEQTKAGEIVHSTEPGETRWKNIKIKFSSWVIPEQML
jgi:putative cardiolipin synthase